MGRSSKPRYQAVWAFTRQNELVLVVPECVYDKLTDSSLETVIELSEVIERGLGIVGRT